MTASLDIIVRERFGNDVGVSRDEDMLSSRLQGTRRCRLMISKVCSFERSSSSSSSSGSSTGGSGSGLSSREVSNTELSSSEDAGNAPDSTSASEDMLLDDGGEPPLQRQPRTISSSCIPANSWLGLIYRPNHQLVERIGLEENGEVEVEVMAVMKQCTS